MKLQVKLKDGEFKVFNNVDGHYISAEGFVNIWKKDGEDEVVVFKAHTTDIWYVEFLNG